MSKFNEENMETTPGIQNIRINGDLTIEGKLVLVMAFEEADKASEKLEVNACLVGRGDPNVFLVESCRVLGNLLNNLVTKQGERALIYARMLNSLSQGFNGECITAYPLPIPHDHQEGVGDE